MPIPIRRALLSAALVTLSPALATTYLALGPSATAQTSSAATLALPSSGTVFVQQSSNADSKLTTLHPTESLFKRHAGSNFARGLVYAGPHVTVDIDGTHASTTLSASTPVFYVRLTSDAPEISRSQLTLVRVRVEKKERVVIDMTENVFGGSHKRYVDEVEATKSDVEGQPNVVKLVPSAKLTPGEYALIFLPKDPHQFENAVYDFSVAEN